LRSRIATGRDGSSRGSGPVIDAGRKRLSMQPGKIQRHTNKAR